MNELLSDLVYFYDTYWNISFWLQCAIRSSLIVIVALSLLALMRNQSSMSRNWILRATFVGMLGLMIWQLAPSKPSAELFQWQTQPIPIIHDDPSIVQKDLEEPMLFSSVEAYRPPSLFLTHFLVGLDSWILKLWLGVSVLLAFGYTFKSLLCNYWLRRNSSRLNYTFSNDAFNAIDLYCSRFVDTPIIAGYLRPSIYLPVDAKVWPEQKLAYAIKHEIGHKVHRDLWWQAGCTLTSLFWWWNPLVWAVLSKIKAECEQFADDYVLSQDSDKEHYARVLIDVARRRGDDGMLHGIPMRGSIGLEKRITAIVSPMTARNTVGYLGRGLSIAFCCFVLVCSGTTLIVDRLDLTGQDGRIVHYQADFSNNHFPQGDFHRNAGSLRGWADLHGVARPIGNAISVAALDDAKPGFIENTLNCEPNWEWVTFFVRMKPDSNVDIGKTHEAGLVILQEDEDERLIASPVMINERARGSCVGWVCHSRTVRIAPTTEVIRVRIQVEPGAGQLMVSEIFAVPSHIEDELDHQLVDKFFQAIEVSDIALVATMLEQEPRLLESRSINANGGTPLMVCAWNELPEMAQFLIDQGASIHAIDNTWKSPALSWCGWWGSPATAFVLVNAGADPIFKNRYGGTALGSAKAGIKQNYKSPRSDSDYLAVIDILNYESERLYLSSGNNRTGQP